MALIMCCALQIAEQYNSVKSIMRLWFFHEQLFSYECIFRMVINVRRHIVEFHSEDTDFH